MSPSAVHPAETFPPLPSLHTQMFCSSWGLCLRLRLSGVAEGQRSKHSLLILPKTNPDEDSKDLSLHQWVLPLSIKAQYDCLLTCLGEIWACALHPLLTSCFSKLMSTDSATLLLVYHFRGVKENRSVGWGWIIHILSSPLLLQMRLIKREAADSQRSHRV